MDPATVAAAADVGCSVDDADAVGDALLSVFAPTVRVFHARLPAPVVADANTASVALPVVG
jgi:hypothetical protein